MQDPSAVEVIGQDPTRATHAPSDVLRLAVGAVLLVAVTLIGVVSGSAVVAFAADLLRGLDRLPDWLIEAVAVVGQLLGLVTVLWALVAAGRARSVRLVVAGAGAAVAGAALTAALTSLVDARGDQVTELTPIALAGRTGTGSAVALGAIVAVVSVVAPWAVRAWRRAAWTAVVALAITLFATSPVAFDTTLALLAGWVAGTAAVVISGSPSHRPTGASIAAGLAAVGVPLARLEQVSLDARGSTPYLAETPDGRRLFVKALGTDERSADLMFRAYRRLQPRDLGDEKAFSSLRRAVEHEALVALAARDLGVRTPRLVAFATAEPNGCVLAYEAIAGRSLDRLAPEEVTDDVLDGVWAQIVLLRHHRIAHRDLRLANVFVADDGELWMIDFGFSELAASDLLLANDLAELLASSATVVGPVRSAAAGQRAVGQSLHTAVARLQPPMLSGATRAALKADPSIVAGLHQELAAQGAGSPALT